MREVCERHGSRWERSERFGSAGKCRRSKSGRPWDAVGAFTEVRFDVGPVRKGRAVSAFLLGAVVLRRNWAEVRRSGRW